MAKMKEKKQPSNDVSGGGGGGAVKRAQFGTPSRAMKMRNSVGTPGPVTPGSAVKGTPGSNGKDYETRQNAGKVELEYNTEQRKFLLAFKVQKGHRCPPTPIRPRARTRVHALRI